MASPEVHLDAVRIECPLLGSSRGSSGGGGGGGGGASILSVLTALEPYQWYSQWKQPSTPLSSYSATGKTIALLRPWAYQADCEKQIG